MARRKRCNECGRLYDEDEVREQVNAVFQDDLYDEYGSGMCYFCAVSSIKSDLDAGARMDFSLETGLPPNDMPDDWDPSDHD